MKISLKKEREEEKQLIEVKTESELSFIDSESTEIGRVTCHGEISPFLYQEKNMTKHTICSEFINK